MQPRYRHCNHCDAGIFDTANTLQMLTRGMGHGSKEVQRGLLAGHTAGKNTATSTYNFLKKGAAKTKGLMGLVKK
jgi:hypothetical protein